jgi:hypothetical protein
MLCICGTHRTISNWVNFNDCCLARRVIWKEIKDKVRIGHCPRNQPPVLPLTALGQNGCVHAVAPGCQPELVSGLGCLPCHLTTEDKAAAAVVIVQ